MPGPFTSYVPPGVYTRTLFEPTVNNLIDSLRLPVFIGIGQETLQVTDLEMVRGSSAIVDTHISKEDVDSRWVIDDSNPADVELGENDGTYKKFRVSKYPIVTGEGQGVTTTDPTDVTVLVDGEQVNVASIDGANGYVTLQSFPRSGSTVRCSYYFSREDTRVTDDLSDQADGSNTVFKVFNVPIVDGTNGGITSTDVSDVTVKVNGTAVTVDSIDGTTGELTLAAAPTAGAVVTATYHFNAWQNTFDYLPDVPTEIVRVGVTPGDSSYIEGTDFVVKDRYIYWGASYTVESGVHTEGSEYFDDTQVTVTLVDNMVYLDECAEYTDDEGAVSDTVVRLTYIPTMGNGRDTTLGSDTYNALTNGRIDVVTDRPDLITAYVGVDVYDAKARPAVTLTKVDGANRLITLATPLSPNEKVFASYYTNFLADDTYTLECVTAGASGTGEYTVTSETLDDNLYHVEYVSKSAISQEINWDTGSQTVVGAFHDGSGTPIEEYVKLTFATNAARGATLKSSVEGPWLINTTNNKIKVNNTTVTLSSSTPATLTGTASETFDLDGLTLILAVDGGSAQTVTFAADAMSAADVVTAITNAALTGVTASASTGRVVLTTTSLGDDATLEIGNGTANSVLGFSAGDSDTGAHTPVATVVSDLTSGLTGITAAASGNHVVLTVATTGAASQLTIQAVANSAYTTLGFEVGQTDYGEAAYQTYTVASYEDSGLTTLSAAGSGTGDTTFGVVGQTFIDDVTGLRLNILAPDGGTSYDAAGYVVIHVTSTFTCNSSTPIYAIPGCEVKVSNTSDVTVGDTATLETFDKAGSEPSIGDYYYISYHYEKPDMNAKVFSVWRDIVSEYGELNSTNKLTLAMYLAILNGALLVAGKQVPVETGGTDATTTDYLTAIDSLRKPVQRRYKPSVIVPVTTNQTVISYCKTHCLIQSSIRYKQERVCIFGFAEGTEPEDAQAYAQGLASERMWAIYPDSAVVALTDEQGNEVEHIVDGAFLAAAVAGSNVAPTYDVATPMTFRQIVGFKRLVREMDEVEKNQTAVAGITVLEDLDPNIRIRQAFTTNMSSSLLREPTITTIADHVQQVMRREVEQFIGIKFLGGVVGDIERVLKTALRGLVQAQIISSFRSVRATPDPTDPTSVAVEITYVPVFGLNTITITFNLRSR